MIYLPATTVEARRMIRAGTAAPILVAGVMMLWPALLNGYPLVFADSGTYLSQAIDGYLGWDRPVFYSLLLRLFHLKTSTWPPVVAQAGMTAWLLCVLLRCMLPAASAWWLVPLTGMLSIASPLPWFVSELMPDIFTSVVVIVLLLLTLYPAALHRWERLALFALGVAAVAVHSSHLPLALALILLLVPLRRRLRLTGQFRRADLAVVVLVPCLAAAATIGINLIGHHRASILPFGNVFLLARMLSDGPGRTALQQSCPTAGWRLCAYADRIPADSDHFLWDAGSPLYRAGGPKLVSAEADAIIWTTLRSAPLQEARAFIRNAADQLARFSTGDGLQPWPSTVRPVIARSFPAAELARYDAAQQTTGELAIPAALLRLHRAVASAGLAGLCLVLLRRQRNGLTGLAGAVLLALVVNAAITGGLSAPHDRYQARLIWLPTAVLMVAGAAQRSDKKAVMRGLDPRIHLARPRLVQVDRRIKSGDDGANADRAGARG